VNKEMANEFKNGSNRSKMKYFFVIIFFLLAFSLLISGYLNSEVIKHTAKLQYTKNGLYSFKDKTETLRQAKMGGEVDTCNFSSFSHYNPAIATSNRILPILSKEAENKVIVKLIEIQVPDFIGNYQQTKNICCMEM